MAKLPSNIRILNKDNFDKEVEFILQNHFSSNDSKVFVSRFTKLEKAGYRMFVVDFISGEEAQRQFNTWCSGQDNCELYGTNSISIKIAD